MCCYMPLSIVARGTGRDLEWIMLGELAVTPPFIFAWDAFRDFSDLNFPDRKSLMQGYAVAGMVEWAIIARILWSAARARFERLTNRGIWERPIEPPVVRVRGPRGPVPGDRAPPND
jgi:hypothetical protein